MERHFKNVQLCSWPKGSLFNALSTQAERVSRCFVEPSSQASSVSSNVVSSWNLGDSWDVVMHCSLSSVSIVFHCTVQLNVLANRQCVSPGALWCWIGFCGSVRSNDTTDTASLLDVQVILSRWLWLWSDVVFPCQSDADINESRSNGELVTSAAIKIGWRPFCVWF